MSEAVSKNENLEAVELAIETFEERLQSGEADTGLVEDFTAVEKLVFKAGQQGDMSVTDGLEKLAGYATRSHQACIEKGFSDGDTFFVAKYETYRNMMEAMASRPESDPKPTDTEKRNMSDPKNRV